MSTWLRLGRAAMALAIVVGIVAQFNYSSDRTAFSATNFFSYFTILSNIIAAVALAIVAARPAVRDHVGLGHVLRGAATLYMTVTGIVYATLLAPAGVDVDVQLVWVNLVIHVIGPIVVVGDWLIDPPRTAPSVSTAGLWLVVPSVWLVYTLIRGPIVDWYPYPFLDPNERSTIEIVIVCVGIFVLFIALAAGVRWWPSRRRSTSPAVAA
jgi:hypothetical protein